MNEKEIQIYVGKRIREERKNKKMTQKELGDKIGLKHNTISSYEKGTNAPEQNSIFKIARALDVKVDDLFPAKEESNGMLDEALQMAKGDLKLKDVEFLNQLIKKTLSFDDEEEREKFLRSLKFTVDYYENEKKED